MTSCRRELSEPAVSELLFSFGLHLVIFGPYLKFDAPHTAVRRRSGGGS